MRGATVRQSMLSFCLLSLSYSPAAAQSSVSPGVGGMNGKVSDVQGEAISTALVTASAQANGKQYRTATDCRGIYQLRDLQPGTYTVRIEAQHFRPETRTVTPAAGQIEELNVRLAVGAFMDGGPQLDKDPELTGLISGTIFDGAGAPVRTQITATIRKTGEHYQTATDSNGVYRLERLPGGSYHLKIEAPGHKAVIRKSVVVHPPGGACLDVRLAR